MASVSQNNSKVVKSFIFTGDVSINDSVRYERMIKCLGGRQLSCNNEQFISSCTHILCFQFFSSVKIIGGLVSGKWLLEKEYIEDSYKTGKWLEEEPYEVKKYNEIAKFHRLRKRKLFGGSVFYIEAEHPNICKSFLRVLVAGGAKIVSRSDYINDHYRIDCAITDKYSYESVKGLVGEHTPILSFDFIKETVFFKHDPGDTRKFLFNPESVPRVKDDVDISERQMPAFVQKILSNSDGCVCVSPSKGRVRRRTKTTQVPFTKRNYSNIASYFVKKAGDLTYQALIQSKKPRVDYCSTNTEVEFIREVKTERGKTEHEECIVIDDSPQRIKKEQSGALGLNQTQDPPQHYPKPDLKDYGESSSLDSTKLTSDVSSPLSIQKDLAHGQGCTSISSVMKSSPCRVAQATISRAEKLSVPCQSPQKTVQPVRVLKDANNSYKSDNMIVQKSKQNPPSEATPVENSSPTLKTGEVINSKTVFEQNMEKLLKSERATVKLNDDCMSRIVSGYLIQLNTSYHYLNCNHIPVYPHQELIAAPRELSPEESLCSSALEDSIQLTTKKVGRCKIYVAEKAAKADFTPEDHFITLESLEWLQLQIQPDIIPNSSTLGLTIKNLIVRCSSRDVSTKALNILQCMIRLHPPCNKRMRNYYLSVLQKATPSDSVSAHTQYKGWSFLELVVKDVIADPSTVNYDVHTLMDLLLLLLELDMIHYNKNPINVTSLLSYRFFWVGVNQNPSVMNSAVKDLTGLWVQTAEMSRSIRRTITKTFSIMLEILWKWSDEGNPFSLTPWPPSSSWVAISLEMLSRFKEIEQPRLLLNLVQALSVPWQQMFVGSVAYRSFSSSSQFHLSLSSLMRALTEEVGLCKKWDRTNSETENHNVRVRLLTILVLSFCHGTGYKYSKRKLIELIRRSLKHPDGVHYAEDHSDAQSELSVGIQDEGAPARPQDSNSSAAGIDEGAIPDSCQGSKEGSGKHGRPSVDLDPSMKSMVSGMIDLFKTVPSFTEEFNELKKKCTHLLDVTL